ncbi:hypothetical protein FQR65_LT03943 [Abscondita terminalis]|nr:hypothetical protein FQR65_LT03943 [Abscondita terminalis]
MAVPFTVEDESDNYEIVLQQLFSDLRQTLQQIVDMQRLRRTQNLLATTRATSIRRPREHGTQTEFSEALFNSTVNLALSPAGAQNGLEMLLQLESLFLPVRRLHRRRSQSEPPFCKEVKPVKVSVSVEVGNKDWIQQEQSTETSTKKKWCGSENLLSKLVPAPFSGPLWTAVICVVGWHLLRTRVTAVRRLFSCILKVDSHISVYSYSELPLENLVRTFQSPKFSKLDFY